MEHSNIEAIIHRAAIFNYSTIHELADAECASAEIIANGAACVVLSVPSKHDKEIYWTANNAECILRPLDEVEGRINIRFVPSGAVQEFMKHGYIIKAQYIDYFNSDIAMTLGNTSDIDIVNFAVLEDAPVLAAIAASCVDAEPAFADMDNQWFSEWLGENKVIVTDRDGEIAGFCCVGRYADVVWIRGMAVRPDLQSRGIGRRLLTQALVYGYDGGAKRAFLHVDKNNNRAITLYNKMDFIATDGEGEIVMVR
jgi:GNAT superfamily N-acetyltransferase